MKEMRVPFVTIVGRCNYK